MSADPHVLCAAIGELISVNPREPLSVDKLEEQRAIYFENQAREQRIRDLRDQVINLFATQRGWRWSRTQFLVETLAEGRTRDRATHLARLTEWPREFADHRTWYRTPDRQTIGLVGQPYATVEALKPKAEAWAAQHGLKVTFPDFPSWWFPGRTIVVLFERQDGSDLERAA